jgi:hypothetical protein
LSASQIKQHLRHWFDVAANLWLCVFILYFVIGTVSALFSRKASDVNPVIGYFYFAWVFPIVLPALAVLWLLERLEKLMKPSKMTTRASSETSLMRRQSPIAGPPLPGIIRDVSGDCHKP